MKCKKSRRRIKQWKKKESADNLLSVFGFAIYFFFGVRKCVFNGHWRALIILTEKT